MVKKKTYFAATTNLSTTVQNATKFVLTIVYEYPRSNDYTYGGWVVLLNA